MSHRVWSLVLEAHVSRDKHTSLSKAIQVFLIGVLSFFFFQKKCRAVPRIVTYM